MRYIGVHVSISGGMHTALLRASDLGINTIQVFLKNSNRWNSKAFSNDETSRFFQAKKLFKDIKIFAHSGYLVNLAGDDKIISKSIGSLKNEIELASALKIKYIVIHPGSHKGIGESNGISRIASSIDKIFNDINTNNVNILLETTAGQGTSIGYRFEHLRDIIGQSKYSSRIHICLDTSHIFAAGYDFTTPESCNKTINEFDKIVGLKHLKLIHLNDSKKGLSSRVDRHEHIGKGKIGQMGFKLLLNDKRLISIPLILETPKERDPEDDIMNLKKVYRIIQPTVMRVYRCF